MIKVKDDFGDFVSICMSSRKQLSNRLWKYLGKMAGSEVDLGQVCTIFLPTRTEVGRRVGQEVQTCVDSERPAGPS